MFGLVALLALAVAPATAETRSWRSADGSRSFEGEYLRHDDRRVTVRRSDGRVLTFDLAMLHADDREWLAGRDTPEAPADDPTAPDESAVFDTLKLGDSHADIRAKLKESKLLELVVAETFLGRFGLNGTYRTRQQIGGQSCLLFFDWTSPGGDADPRLRELSLQTEPASGSSYDSRLRETWTEFAALLTKLHGPPLQSADFPPRSDLSADGVFLGSHLWRLENGHSAVLGTARDQGKYTVVVRFTTEKIEPIKYKKNGAAQAGGPAFPGGEG